MLTITLEKTGCALSRVPLRDLDVDDDVEIHSLVTSQCHISNVKMYESFVCVCMCIYMTGCDTDERCCR